VELLAEKKEGAPSSSKDIVVHTEPVQKIELMPNDVKLGLVSLKRNSNIL